IYGRLEPSAAVRINCSGTAPLWVATVFGLNAANSIADVATLPGWAAAGVLAHSLALRITRTAGTDYVMLAEPAAEGPPGLSRSWRLAEFETDAAMMFCRTDTDGRLTRAAMVDGARLRCAGGARVTVA